MANSGKLWFAMLCHIEHMIMSGILWFTNVYKTLNFFLQKLKVKIMRACVTPAYVCGLETAALTRPQQQKLTFARSTRSLE